MARVVCLSPLFRVEDVEDVYSDFGVSTQTLAIKGDMDNIMERLTAMQRTMNRSGDRNEFSVVA